MNVRFLEIPTITDLPAILTPGTIYFIKDIGVLRINHGDKIVDYGGVTVDRLAYIAPKNFGTSDVSQAVLSNYAQTYLKQTVIKDNSEILNLSDNNLWIYNAGLWVNIGKVAATVATEVTAGTVISSSGDAQLSVNSAGIGSINGLTQAVIQSLTYANNPSLENPMLTMADITDPNIPTLTGSHPLLINRDIPDAHPISAITGLGDVVSVVSANTEDISDIELALSSATSAINVQINSVTAAITQEVSDRTAFGTSITAAVTTLTEAVDSVMSMAAGTQYLSISGTVLTRELRGTTSVPKTLFPADTVFVINRTLVGDEVGSLGAYIADADEDNIVVLTISISSGGPTSALLGNVDTHAALPADDATAQGLWGRTTALDDYANVLADETIDGSPLVRWYVTVKDETGAITWGNPLILNTSNYQAQSLSTDAGKVLIGGATPGTFGTSLNLDTVPTSGSQNPITSGAVADAIEAIDDGLPDGIKEALIAAEDTASATNRFATMEDIASGDIPFEYFNAITESGQWVCPRTATYDIYVVGGGGGGGGNTTAGSDDDSRGGGGGGGGVAHYRGVINAATVATVVIGSGGANGGRTGTGGPVPGGYGGDPTIFTLPDLLPVVGGGGGGGGGGIQPGSTLYPGGGGGGGGIGGDSSTGKGARGASSSDFVQPYSGGGGGAGGGLSGYGSGGTIASNGVPSQGNSGTDSTGGSQGSIGVGGVGGISTYPTNGAIPSSYGSGSRGSGPDTTEPSGQPGAVIIVASEPEEDYLPDSIKEALIAAEDTASATNRFATMADINGSSNFEVFTVSRNYIIKSTRSYTIHIIGGGGGGGAMTGTACNGGGSGGGGSGGLLTVTLNLTAGTVLSTMIGAGGTAGTVGTGFKHGGGGGYATTVTVNGVNYTAGGGGGGGGAVCSYSSGASGGGGGGISTDPTSVGLKGGDGQEGNSIVSGSGGGGGGVSNGETPTSYTAGGVGGGGSAGKGGVGSSSATTNGNPGNLGNLCSGGGLGYSSQTSAGTNQSKGGAGGKLSNPIGVGISTLYGNGGAGGNGRKPTTADPNGYSFITNGLPGQNGAVILI